MKLIFVVLILLSSVSVSAKPNITYKVGDQLYVLSKYGLHLRAKPSKQGRLLQTISFGTSVLVRQFTEKEYDVDGIRGFWVKVIAEDREGYLFDGFLSSYPPPVSELPSKFIPTLKQYKEKFLPKDTIVSEMIDEKNTVTSTLILPVIRLEEAYLLGICFLYNFDKYKFPKKADKVQYPETEVEFQIERTKSGEISSVAVIEAYLISGEITKLIVKDLGNEGVEIKTIIPKL